MEALIEATIQDGVLTDQEKAVLVKRAQKEGIDVDELDVYIQSLLQKRQQLAVAAEIKAEKSNITGTVKRCVRCGGFIPLGDAVCPDCGFAFSDNTEGNAVSILQKGLRDLDKEWKEVCKRESAKNPEFSDSEEKEEIDEDFCKQKISYVTSFMVPNNRADLLQLLAFTKSRANVLGNIDEDDDSDDDISSLGYAYWCLFENCITLAQVSFSNDLAFKQFFDYYDRELEKRELKKRKNSFVTKIVLCLIVVFFVLFYGYLYISGKLE